MASCTKRGTSEPTISLPSRRFGSKQKMKVSPALQSARSVFSRNSRTRISFGALLSECSLCAASVVHHTFSSMPHVWSRLAPALTGCPSSVPQATRHRSCRSEALSSIRVSRCGPQALHGARQEGRQPHLARDYEGVYALINFLHFLSFLPLGFGFGFGFFASSLLCLPLFMVSASPHRHLATRRGRRRFYVP